MNQASFDDAVFMASGDWPMGNVLPVKNSKNTKRQLPIAGFLVKEDNGTINPTVYEIPWEEIQGRQTCKDNGGGILDLICEPVNTGADKLTRTVIAKFVTFNELVTAGWIVD